MGIPLNNPLVVSSSGLTNSANKVVKLERAGAGAVVLKSLFEEQIIGEVNAALYEHDYPEAFDYVNTYVKENKVNDYLLSIKDCKNKSNIPIIASINCCTSGEWVNLAKEIELAGADGLELNVFVINTASNISPGEYDSFYLDILKKVRAVTNLPLSMKVGHSFSNLIHLSDQLFHQGLNGLVIFNRFYQPDINLDTLSMKGGEVYSSPHDLGEVLRWTSLISGHNSKFNVAASTGIHDWDSVLKVLLAGASSAQICSTIYMNGMDIISQMLTCIEEWMNTKGFSNLEEFKGLLSAKHSKHASFYERVQFMKYFDSI